MNQAPQQAKLLGHKGAGTTDLALAARAPVSGWGRAGAFTVHNPAPDASPSREVPMPAGNREGSR